MDRFPRPVRPAAHPLPASAPGLPAADVHPAEIGRNYPVEPDPPTPTTEVTPMSHRVGPTRIGPRAFAAVAMAAVLAGGCAAPGESKDSGSSGSGPIKIAVIDAQS